MDKIFDKKIKEALETIRKNVFNRNKCPRCGHKLKKIYTKKYINWYYCAGCRKRNKKPIFNDLTFTIFSKSKVSFKIIYLICFFFSKNQNASEIQRSLKELGFNLTIKTIWKYCHKLRKIIANVINKESIKIKKDIFEVDEFYVKCKHMTSLKKRFVKKKAGRGSTHTVCVQLYTTKQKNKTIFFNILKKVNAKEMKEFYDKIKDKIIEVHSDEFQSYFFIKNNHFFVNHSKKQYVKIENNKVITTNNAESIIAYIKNKLRRYKCVALHYLHMYLYECIFKLYNNKTANDIFMCVQRV